LFAKCAARQLLQLDPAGDIDTDQHYMCVDFSRMREDHDLTTLFGVVGGLVGSDGAAGPGTLAPFFHRALNNQHSPVSAVLHIDEVDKAGPKILTRLMEILDVGKLQLVQPFEDPANPGKYYNVIKIEKLVVIMTSNYGAGCLTAAMRDKTEEELKCLVEDIQKNEMVPSWAGNWALLGRIGCYIPMLGFTQAQKLELIEGTVFRMLTEKLQGLRRPEVVIETLSTTVREALLGRWDDTGVRSIVNYIGETLFTSLGLWHDAKPTTKLRVKWNEKSGQCEIHSAGGDPLKPLPIHSAGGAPLKNPPSNKETQKVTIHKCRT
jgi:ATP-dependent Clp protease ATP-binding subunit ClpA